MQAVNSLNQVFKEAQEKCFLFKNLSKFLLIPTSKKNIVVIEILI